MATTYLDRYLAGDHEGVWGDLHRLGEAVREPQYRDDAVSVARETVRRAKLNFETIIQRLDSIGYRFDDAHNQAVDHQQQVMDLGQMIRATLPQARTTVRDFPVGGNAMKAMQTMLGAFEKLQTFQVSLQERSTSAPKPRVAVDHLKDESIYLPASRSAVKRLAAFEKKLGGPLPLLLVAWYEQIEHICLSGANPELCPAGTDWAPDPFAMYPLETDSLAEYQSGPTAAQRRAQAEKRLRELDQSLETWRKAMGVLTPEMESRIEANMAPRRAEILEELARTDRTLPYQLPLGPDEIAKAGESGDFYYVDLPNAGADFPVVGLAGVTFLQYLRQTFACGGFPGWFGRDRRPAVMETLSRDLLPI